jgi:uncharacterized membrane protein YoaK (UPF0700 family)
MKRRLRDLFQNTEQNLVDLLPLDSALLVRHRGGQGARRNRQLAVSLAFVAGAANAGGFLVLHFYTSHVTGAISQIADLTLEGAPHAALDALKLVAAFMAGAFCSETLCSFGRRARFRSPYAFSLAVQAGLLGVFGILGGRADELRDFYLPVTALLLSFIMGMLNAVVTTISNAEVRVTHMTGNTTDFGVEMSRLLYFNIRKGAKSAPVVANRDRLKLHGFVLAAFLSGAFAGAWGFKRFGFEVAWALAGILLLLAFRPLLWDARIRLRWMAGLRLR